MGNEKAPYGRESDSQGVMNAGPDSLVIRPQKCPNLGVSAAPGTVPGVDAELRSAESMQEPEESPVPNDPTASLDSSDHEGETAPPSESEASEDDGEETILTMVGRIIVKDGKRIIVDEAVWNRTDGSNLENWSVVLETRNGKDFLTISSSFLRQVFLSIVREKHFPGLSVSFWGISIPAPFAPLYFYYDKILDMAKDPEALSGFEEWRVQRDVSALSYWYDKWVSQSHRKLRESLRQGGVTYEDLWAIYRPGDLLYGMDDFKRPRIYVIAATLYRRADMPQEALDAMPFSQFLINTKSRFVIEAWHVGWDSGSRLFTRKSAVFSIAEFSGSRRITDLDVYPLQHYQDGNQEAAEKLLLDLEARGRMWKDLVSSTSSCMQHDGPAELVRQSPRSDLISRVENVNLNERVVVDNDGYKIFGVVETHQLGNMLQMFSLEKRELPIISGGFGAEYSGYDRCSPGQPFDVLQAQTCPSDIYCCSIQTSKWYHISICNLKPVEWTTDAIENLVAEEKYKNLLQRLVESHKADRTMGGTESDFVPKKGQGLVIVLHGPPGVGKTLTAESIAEYAQKPLYSINIGELTSEPNVASKLETIFALATRWGAVLLMDEADVVLEKRSYENLQRNGVVSVFLRMLEYYRGIVFLTTNRLGAMDIAFQSRITLAIKYYPLTPDLRRQIWLNFIRRLSPIEEVARRELMERLDDIQEWPFNGRQIRNIVNMSQSLALAQTKLRGSLRYEHVEQMAQETLHFQDFFEEQHRESRVKLSEVNDRAFKEKRVVRGSSEAQFTGSSVHGPWR